MARTLQPHAAMARLFAHSLAFSALLCAAGCHEPRVPAAPLPALAAEQRSAPATAIRRGGHFRSGERMTWNVAWRGMTVGRAELVVGPSRSDGTVVVVSRFRTRGVAESVRPIRLSLTTSLDARSLRPLRAAESLRISGATRQQAYALQTKPRETHTLQTALGIVRERARQRPGPTSGYLFVVFDGDRYRVDVSAPAARDDGIHVQCRAVKTDKHGRVDPRATAFVIEVLLSPAPRLAPLRVDIHAPKGKLAADLIEHTTNL